MVMRCPMNQPMLTLLRMASATLHMPISLVRVPGAPLGALGLIPDSLGSRSQLRCRRPNLNKLTLTRRRSGTRPQGAIGTVSHLIATWSRASGQLSSLYALALAGKSSRSCPTLQNVESVVSAVAASRNMPRLSGTLMYVTARPMFGMQQLLVCLLHRML